MTPENEPAADRSRQPPHAAVRVVDSIAELSAADRGCIAVSGSHGGASAARYALAAQPVLAVFNDAGVGRDAAGIAGLAMLEDAGIAAATVSHDSARIGDGASTRDDGIISHANSIARRAGVQPGMSCRQCLPLFRRSP